MALKRDLILVSGGRLAAVLLALISIRAVTTLLTPAQYGELALLIAVQMFCGLFLVNPVGQHINLHTHVWWDEGSLMARLKPYRRYIAAVSIVGALLVLIVEKLYSAEQMVWAAIAMFVLIAAGTWNATLVPMLNMLGFRAASVVWSVVTAISGLASSIMLVMWSASVTAWIAGQAIGMTLGAVGAWLFLQRKASQNGHASAGVPLINRQTVMAYCLPLALGTGLMWLQLSGYRFAVEKFWGLTQLGLMVVGLQLAGQIWAFAETLAMQFFYPMFYRRIAAKENAAQTELAFSDLLNTLAPLYFVLTGLIILSAPYLLKLLVAPEFSEALNFVMLGAGIELCRVLANLLSNAAHITRHTMSLAFPYAAGSIVALGLIWLTGTRQMEIIWAGMALMVAAIAMFTAMLINMYQQVKFVPDMARYFGGATIMLAMALLVTWMPQISGLGATLGMLTLTTIPAGIAMLALLWKNPAAIRLLNVQLRKN